MTRSYTELSRLHTFEERFRYLSVRSTVADPTFGFERYLNQRFYRSTTWRRIRRDIVVRDNGCDLGIEDFPIAGKIIVHHMNPMTVDEVINAGNEILDPEFLISVSLRTHNAIHFGDESLLAKPHVDRKPGDTQLWSRAQ